MNILHKISLKKMIWPFLLLILIIPSFYFLTQKNIYWNMHDDMQLIRQLEMEKCFLDGQLPCRWTPDLGFGYGYPLFNYYPPLPYFVGQIVRIFGISFINTIKIVFLLQIIFSAFAMYFLVKTIYGKIPGLISALFYTYAPYHAVNIYVRGAMNESWATVFFPLIFLFFYKLVLSPNTKNLILASLSLSGLLLSHNPMALTFLPFLGAWWLFWLISKHGLVFIKIKKVILFSFLAGIYSLCLSAFFTIPVLAESSLVQIESMFQNYYHYSVHFVSVFQLFISSFWGDGPSVWGTEDQMSFSIGYLHWLTPLVYLFYVIIRHIKHKKIDKKLTSLVLVSFLAVFATFMSHEKSTIFWKLFSLVQKIQFPWRFLSHAYFLFSLASAGIYYILDSNIIIKKIVLPLVLVILLGLNIKFFTPVTYGPVTDEQKFSGLAWQNQITSGIYDYLPKTASTAAKNPPKQFVDEISPINDYKISGEKRGTDWQLFNLYLEKPSIVILSNLYFPDFKVFDFGKEIPLEVEPYLGRIRLNLSSGDHQLYIKLYDTPVRRISNYVSVFSLLMLAIIFIYPTWRRSILKK